MKLLLPIFLIFSIPLFGQTKQDSIRWEKVAKQRIIAGKDTVYQQLLRAKQFENYLNPPRLSYNTKQYYIEESKQLLVEVLKNDWMTDAQKLALAKKMVWKRINNEIVTSETIINDTIKYSGFSKSRKKHFESHADSLKRLKVLDVDTVDSFQTLIRKWVENINKHRIPDLYIYTAGMLDDSRFIPVLLEALEDSIHYNPLAIKMALARFGVKPFVNEMMEKNKVDLKLFKRKKDQDYVANRVIFPALAYLATNDAIREYSKLLILKHFECIDLGDYEKCSIPQSIVENLYSIILNIDFRNYLRNYMIGEVAEPKKLSKEVIIWVQNWLEENYGNYKLNRNYYPRF